MIRDLVARPRFEAPGGEVEARTCRDRRFATPAGRVGPPTDPAQKPKKKVFERKKMIYFSYVIL